MLISPRLLQIFRWLVGNWCAEGKDESKDKRGTEHQSVLAASGLVYRIT